MRKNSSLGRLGARQFRKIAQSPALFPTTTTIIPIDRQSFAASHKSLEEVRLYSWTQRSTSLVRSTDGTVSGIRPELEIHEARQSTVPVATVWAAGHASPCAIPVNGRPVARHIHLAPGA